VGEGAAGRHGEGERAETGDGGEAIQRQAKQSRTSRADWPRKPGATIYPSPSPLAISKWRRWRPAYRLHCHNRSKERML